jgi:hypothetical protein
MKIREKEGRTEIRGINVFKKSRKKEDKQEERKNGKWGNE